MNIIETARRFIITVLVGNSDLSDIRARARSLIASAQGLADRNNRVANAYENRIANLQSRIEDLDAEADEALVVVEGLSRLLGDA